MADYPSVPFSILILAGGRGQRMGGADKGLVTWRGRALVAHLHDRLRPLTDDLIVSCNRNLETYRTYADRCVADLEPNHAGPLAGIRAGLAVARHNWLVVMPCDSPLIDADLVGALISTAQAQNAPVMLRRAHRWEPLHCALPTHCRLAIEQAWRAGVRSPRDVLLPLGTQPLQLHADEPRLANFNTPESLDVPEAPGT